MRSRIALALAVACALAACGKKDEPLRDAPKPTTSGMPPSATTPGTLPASTPPDPTTQPASAEPGTDKAVPPSTIAPRNFMVGNAIGADKKVTQPVDSIAPAQTAYASVDLYGTGQAKVRTVWSYKGKEGKTDVVKSDTETVNVTAPRSVESHLSNPAGLQTGSYEVEVLVNEATAGKKQFSVK